MSKNIQKAVFIALAIDYFTRHTSSDECHITSDERVFHSVGTAKSFANLLEDETVHSFTRAEATNEIEVVEDEGTGTGEGTEALTLETFNAETSDYKEALELFKTLELKAESNKKADVFAALTAAKNAIEPNKE